MNQSSLDDAWKIVDTDSAPFDRPTDGRDAVDADMPCRRRCDRRPRTVDTAPDSRGRRGARTFRAGSWIEDDRTWRRVRVPASGRAREGGGNSKAVCATPRLTMVPADEAGIRTTPGRRSDPAHRSRARPAARPSARHAAWRSDPNRPSSVVTPPSGRVRRSRRPPPRAAATSGRTMTRASLVSPRCAGAAERRR